MENLGHPEKTRYGRDLTSEYTGKLGEWRRRCADATNQNEKAEWRREKESTQYVRTG